MFHRLRLIARLFCVAHTRISRHSNLLAAAQSVYTVPGWGLHLFRTWPVRMSVICTDYNRGPGSVGGDGREGRSTRYKRDTSVT